MASGEPGSDGTRRRADIQALRGYAVAVVILFHAGLGVAPSGYLGVDVFFVVSGYLIGGIVMRGRIAGDFRLRTFYARRIRRLLPAAYAMLAVVTLAAILLLTPSAYDRFWPQLAHAIGFATNIVLWRQINYFNDSATVEPLLHMWSLAIEEQYYLLLPALLAIVPRRFWFFAIAAGTLASLVAYVWLYPRAPGAAFYLLPTRAWEIGLGSLAACVKAAPRARRLVAPAAALLLALLFVQPPAHLAYLLAIPACVATVAILLGDGGLSRALRWLEPIGDRSYSLYLVHWPLFAFANTIYLAAPLPTGLALALVAATAVLGTLSYRYVEEPLRRAAIPERRLWRTALIASIALLALGAIGLQHRRPSLDLHGVTGLDLPGCDADATAFDGRCTQTPAPQILVWGDSYSQHLIPALLADPRHPIAQASKGGCPPLIAIAPLDIQADETTARGCIAYNSSVLAYLARTPSVEVVVLSARYLRYAIPGTRALVGDPGGTHVLKTADIAHLAKAQRDTAAAIRAFGKRVVLIAAPPQARFDVGQCWSRLRAHLPFRTAAPACAIVAANAHPLYPFTRDLMTAFARSTPVITFDAALCETGTCATAIDGIPLYRDTGHLSAAGSTLIGRRWHLTERAWRDAR